MRDKPADATEIAGITERGRAIAAYDQVAWHATDAVLAMHPAKDAVEMYIGRQTPKGWEVAFGKLNPAKDGFLLAYEAEPTGDVLHPRIVASITAAVDREEWLDIARAYDLSRSQLRVSRQYNGTVLKAPEGNWYVYFYPAQTNNDSYPMGADTRFLVSHDGTKILETHPMHMSLLETAAPKGTKTEMTFHNAVLDDAPEDTDVANVLMMGGIPMLIACKTFSYKVEADGKISFLGTTKDFLKSVKK